MSLLYMSREVIQPCHSGGANGASVRFLPGVDSHVHGQLHLVEVLLITESAGVHKAALVPVLTMLQRLVVPVLLPTH